MKVFIGMEKSGQLRRRFQALGHYVISVDFGPSEDGSRFDIATGGHIEGDVFETFWKLHSLGVRFERGIFHPDCTFHTVSAAWAFNDPDFNRYPGVGYHQRVRPGTLTGAARRDARAKAESELEVIRLLPIERKVVENPIGTISKRTKYGKPAQIVHPYHFGDDASKGTCLWAFDFDGSPVALPIEFDEGKFFPPRMVCDDCGSHSAYAAAFKHGCTACGAEAGKLRPRWSNQTDTGQNRLSPGDDRAADRSRTYPGIADAIIAALA